MKTYLITGGGSGGHIYPALAVADEIMEREPSSRIILVGAKRGMERKLFSQTKYRSYFLPVGQLHSSVGRLTQVWSLMRLPFCFLISVYLVLRFRPKAVFGVGGYASGPLGMISSLLGVPTYVWEANATPGVTNIILGRFNTVPFLVFEKAAKFFKKNKAIMVGLPIRKDFELKVANQSKSVSGSKMNILFVGGSQGAQIFNDVLPVFVDKYGDKIDNVQLVHQTGLKNYESTLKKYKNQMNAKIVVEVLAYLDPIMDYYAAADLVVCRSGASTVVELSIMKKPALFVPFPKASDGHQKSNAISVVEKGAALMIEEADFNPDTLAEAILSLQKNPGRLESLKSASADLFLLGARQKIAKILMS
jgi:UDP-N-acetylglucosamine--N-acetylmuramyl-(pentapeptide) pyrophosphoryl-undecaprenol N-acetylglucosamine transferase